MFYEQSSVTFSLAERWHNQSLMVGQESSILLKIEVFYFVEIGGLFLFRRKLMFSSILLKIEVVSYFVEN